MLERAERKSPLEYLRTLASTHSCTANLVADIKQFDRQFIYTHYQRTDKKQSNSEKRKSTIGTEHVSTHPHSNDIGGESLERGYTEVSNTAERWLEEFFVPRGYLERERLFLNKILPTLTEPYYLSRTKAEEIAPSARPNMFARFAKAADLILPGNESPPIGGAPAIPAQSPQGNIVHDEADMNDLNSTLVTVTITDTIIKILSIHGEAMGRCGELAPSSDLHSYSNKLFSILVNFLSDRFLEAILKRELSQIRNRDTRTLEVEGILKTFRLIEDVNQVMQLLQHHFEFAVLPLVSSSPPSYREVVIKKNTLMTMLESYINLILHAETSQILNWIQKELNMQNRNSYKIDGNAVGMEVLSMPTETCRKCVKVLRRIFDGAKLYFKGANLKAYFIELGTGVHR